MLNPSLSSLTRLLAKADRWSIQRGALFGGLIGTALAATVLFLLDRPLAWLVCGLLLVMAVPLALRNPEVAEEPEESEATPRGEQPQLKELLDMVELPGGEFWMGSPENDPKAFDSEKPRHKVRLSAFAIGTTPVTRRLYRQLTGTSPREWSDGGDDLPATHVTWRQAREFCDQLSVKTGLSPCYSGSKRDPHANGYRLPTEAEWEYAARAGTDTAYSFGNDEDLLTEYAWYAANSDRRLHPVGQKKPNSFGLYDVHGNAWEWCEDAWNHSAYRKRGGDPVTDPIEAGPASASRALRGGAWSHVPWDLRSSNRVRCDPEHRLVFIGFRCVRAVGRQH